MKPMLARDWIESKVKFPCYIQPKIDGVRALNIDGKLYARSLKPHANLHLNELFGQQMFNGLDGEIILNDNPVLPDLCSLTSGAVRREKDTSNFTWYVFDLILPDTIELSYEERYRMLRKHVEMLRNVMGITNVVLIPQYICISMRHLIDYDDEFLRMGYEGSIIRNPLGKYKEGRSDGKMQVWRIKRFIDAEFLIDTVIEGNHNDNEATVNELGRTERSTHQENMIPNGLVGAMEGTLLADVVDPTTNEVILRKGERVKVSPGTMSADMRKHYFENQHELLGQIGKFKFFPKGIKDKPRFPVFLSVRSKEDMS